MRYLKLVSKLFSDFLKLDLVKVFSFTAISTVVKILTAFITVKIVATILGPSGIALIGQLNNFATILMVLASAGINQGVTKYVSENNTSKGNVEVFISTAFKITLYCSALCGLILIVLSKTISIQILNSEEYAYSIESL